MKSKSITHRTASTAVNSKAKLPKINVTHHQDLTKDITKKLFLNNTSLLLPSNNKNNFRNRIKTEITTERTRNLFQSRHQRVQEMGLRRLQEELNHINQMFKQIQKLRQNYGIVSLNDKGEEEERYGPDSKQVPYDPHLHQMNEQIFQIKTQIEESLQEVFRISKEYPKLKQLIEQLLEQHMQQFLVQNGRNGKIAAMKAHHRLIQSSQEKLAKMCRH